MPAEFFHPAVSASQKGQDKGAGAGTLPKIALQGSWASLRSPSVNCTLLRQVRAPPRLQELSWRGTSEWGLEVQVEMEGPVWGMGGLACRASSTALARAASWACRRHGAQSRKASRANSPTRGWGSLGSGRSRSCPGSHSMVEAEPGLELVHLLTPAMCQAVCQARRPQQATEYEIPLSWLTRYYSV